MSFDLRAKNWDTEDRVTRAKEISEEIIRGLNLPKEISVMEFGCGTGLVSFNYKDIFDKITLIDSSQGMIDEVNQKIKSEDIKNMESFCMDFTKGERPDEKFDFIYNSMVLHHISDTKAIFFDFYKRLNKNGFLSIVDLDTEDGTFHPKDHKFDGHKGFNQEELTDMLIDIGFEIIESKSFYSIEKLVDGEKKNYSLFTIKAQKYKK